MSHSVDVYITGVGPVTPIGLGPDQLWRSLRAGRCNVAMRTLPVDLGVTEELPMASMPPAADVPGLAAHLAFLDEQECGGYRDLAYALLAIELALQDAGIEFDPENNTVGAVQAFEAAGIERTVGRLFEMMSMPMPTDGPPRVYEFLAPYFYNSQPFLYVHLVGKAFRFHGFSTSVHNACSSGAFAIETAAAHIRSGQADVMVVVGGEAFDTAVRLEWFRRLDLYAREGVMRPFDRNPSGFYVGEGGAAIVLESAEHAERRGATAYAKYLGGAFAQQGWKQTIPDVRSARLRGVIKRALAESRVAPAEVDLIVPHGASTLLCDGYEASSVEEALGEHASKALATVFKPYVGHQLATSGIIETICAVLALKHQAVPPTPNAGPNGQKFPAPIATTLTERPLARVLKLSTGFTGHDTAMAFAKV